MAANTDVRSRTGGGALGRVVGSRILPPRPGAPSSRGHGNSGGHGGGGQSNPLYNPQALLQGPALNQAAHQIANAQTRGPIAELAHQRAVQLAQGAAAQKQTAGYFNQLGQLAQTGLTQQGQIAGDLNTQLQGIADQTQAKLQGLGQGQLASYQGRVGGDLQGVGLPSLAQTLGAQQGTAALNGQTFRSAGAAQGANYRGLAASNLGAFTTRGQEDLSNIGRASRLATEPLNAKIAGLKATEGALYGTALGQLRSQERNYALARSTLGLKKQDFAFQQKQADPRTVGSPAWYRAQSNLYRLSQAQQQQMRSDRQFKLDQQKFGAQKAKENYLKANGLGPYKPPSAGSGGPGGKPPSAASQNVVVRRVSYVTGRINQLVKQFEHWGAPPQSAASQAWHALHSGYYWGRVFDKTGKWTGKYTWRTITPVGDPSLLNAAFNTRNGGSGLSPGDIAYLKKQGLANPGKYLSPSPSAGGISQGGRNSPH